MLTNAAVMIEVVKAFKEDNGRDGSYPIRRITGENFDFIKGYTMGGDFQFFYDGSINGKRCQMIYWGEPTCSWMPGTTVDEYFDFNRRDPSYDSIKDNELRSVIQLMFDDLKNNPNDSRDSAVISLN